MYDDVSFVVRDVVVGYLCIIHHLKGVDMKIPQNS